MGASPFEGVDSFVGSMLAHPAEFETALTDEEDTAVGLYTSGTTGKPKGAELRHRNLRDNALLGGPLFDCSADSPDTYLAVLPLFHSFGQTVCQNGAFAYGGTVVLMPRVEPSEAMSTMVNEGVTVFAGVPTMYWALLGAAGDASIVSALAKGLRAALSGGSALPAEVHRQFQARFGVTIMEGYGLSETSPVAAFLEPGAEPRIGSIGVPVPGVDMKLLVPESWDELESSDPDAVGEIAIRGHNVMRGYLGRPDATEDALQHGWFRTGDLARRDRDGWYYIVDRAKDMIIRNGLNVYPREIEEVLMQHPAVSLAAVVGVPHPSQGEEVKTFVIPVPGEQLDAETLIAWSKEQLAAYKYPRIVEVVGELPMTSTGKILKRELVWLGGVGPAP